jgi:hypothetical protein
MLKAIYDSDGGSLSQGYARHRRPDARIASAIHAALGDARTVLNVGAGTGSYEPSDRIVQSVEPSERMMAQRPSSAAHVCAQWRNRCRLRTGPMTRPWRY